jgi:hypothetical protein
MMLSGYYFLATLAPEGLSTAVSKISQRCNLPKVGRADVARNRYDLTCISNEFHGNTNGILNNLKSLV